MNYLDNLGDRDKKTLKIASVFIAFILFTFVIILPLKDRKDFYKKKVEAKKKTLISIAVMSERYKDLKEKVKKSGSSSHNKKDDFTLFSFLDRAAADAGLKRQIKAMKPSTATKTDYIESTVVVELENVSITPLVKYMYTIESSGHNIKIRKVDIKPRYSNPGHMSVTLIISAIQNL